MNKDAKRIWASQRYKELIEEYIERSILPPPFHLLSFILNSFLGLIECIQIKKDRRTHPIKNNQNSTNSVEPKTSFCKKLITPLKQKYSKIENNTEKEELVDWYENMAQEFFCQYTEKW